MPYKDKEKGKQYKKQYNKQYYLDNKEKRKQYNLNNKEKIKEYVKNKFKTDPIYKITKTQRNRIYQALKRQYKYKSTIKLLGCSIEECWNHLEKQFQPGMTRDNYGMWHVDHIIPCASFDFNDPEQQKICFHYTNLQPLWAIDNIKKGAKLDYEME